MEDAAEFLDKKFVVTPPTRWDHVHYCMVCTNVVHVFAHACTCTDIIPRDFLKNAISPEIAIFLTHTQTDFVLGGGGGGRVGHSKYKY